MTRVRIFVAALSVPVVLFSGACSKSTEHRKIAAASVNGKAGFTPDVIRATKGDKVSLRVGNTTDRTHGFTITNYGVQRTVDAGKTVVVQFAATQPGRYEIYCQLHPAHQKAALVVK